MKRIILAAIIATTGGCAGGSAPPPQTPDQVAEERAREEAEALRRERDAQQRELQRLEAQLALARAEQERARQAAVRSETVRIGGGVPDSPHDDLFADAPDWSSPEAPAEPEQPADPEPSGPRPVLRLYGSPAVPIEGLGPPVTGGAGGTPAPPVVVPMAPPGVSMRLPVAGSEPPGSSATPAPAVDPAAGEYRRALALLGNRQLGEALTALQAFERRHPEHPYASNALYWQAEVLYMQRRYPDALRRFQAVVSRYPGGAKVPDALLKIGLCYERMGDRSQARAYFRRVRAEFPNSVAARTLPREDAS